MELDILGSDVDEVRGSRTPGIVHDKTHGASQQPLNHRLCELVATIMSKVEILNKS